LENKEKLIELLEIAQNFVDEISSEGKKLLTIVRADKESLPSIAIKKKMKTIKNAQPDFSFIGNFLGSTANQKQNEVENNKDEFQIPEKSVVDCSTQEGLNSYIKKFMDDSIENVEKEIKDLNIRLNAAKWVEEKLSKNTTKEICSAIVNHITSKIKRLKEKAKNLKRKSFEDGQDPELMEFSNSQLYDAYDISSSSSDE
jgi:hypothetical protein